MLNLVSRAAALQDITKYNKLQVLIAYIVLLQDNYC